jgi:hypothetical protein
VHRGFAAWLEVSMRLRLVRSVNASMGANGAALLLCCVHLGTLGVSSLLEWSMRRICAGHDRQQGCTAPMIGCILLACC